MAEVKYQGALRVISELAEHWRRKSSADIPDTEIVDAYSAVAAAAARLPSGSGFAPFMSNLQAQDPDTLEGFKRDLGARARPARRVQEGRPPARCPTATPRSVVAQSARFSSHSTCHRARRAESSLSNLLVSDSQTPSPQHADPAPEPGQAARDVSGKQTHARRQNQDQARAAIPPGATT